MKVGIITHYYKSNNYGGNLQAYALCKCINEMGYPNISAEQISFNMSDAGAKIPLTKKVYRFFRVNIGKIAKTVIPSRRDQFFSGRLLSKQFERFKEHIPHSKKVYNGRNIKDAVNVYDVFITGSDQVWNPQFYSKAFRLDFVPSDKKKISYAASISAYELSNEEKGIFKKSLEDYSGISVREKEP